MHLRCVRVVVVAYALRSTYLNNVRPSWNEIAAAMVALVSTTAVPPATPNRNPAAVVSGMAGMMSTSASTYSTPKYRAPSGPSSSILVTLLARNAWMAVVAALGPALAVSTTLSKEAEYAEKAPVAVVPRPRPPAPPVWSCSLVRQAGKHAAKTGTIRGKKGQMV